MKSKCVDLAKISQKWLEVLIPFTNDYSASFSGSELARLTKIPQRTVARILTQLVNMNLLKLDIRGKNNFYYFDLQDKRIKQLMNLVESYKSLKFSLDTSLWKEIVPLLEFGNVVLFGSRAKGYATKSSDIDLVIFSNKTKKLDNVLRHLSKVQAQTIPFEKFEKLVEQKKILALEVLKNHVVFGDCSKFVNLCWRFYG